MKLKITFKSDITIEGKDIRDILDRFEHLNLFSDEAKTHKIKFVETVSTDYID